LIFSLPHNKQSWALNNYNNNAYGRLHPAISNLSLNGHKYNELNSTLFLYVRVQTGMGNTW